MKLIAEINEPGTKIIDSTQFRLRKAARAVVQNRDGQIAILHVKANNYYKLPGGGVEDGESIQEGLERELIEEIGCRVEVTGEVGITIEYRVTMGLIQLSYVFKGTVIEDLGKVEFTEKEASQGFELIWTTPMKALELIKLSQPKDESGRFIVERDAAIVADVIKIV